MSAEHILGVAWAGVALLACYLAGYMIVKHEPLSLLETLPFVLLVLALAGLATIASLGFFGVIA